MIGQEEVAYVTRRALDEGRRRRPRLYNTGLFYGAWKDGDHIRNEPDIWTSSSSATARLSARRVERDKRRNLYCTRLG